MSDDDSKWACEVVVAAATGIAAPLLFPGPIGAVVAWGMIGALTLHVLAAIMRGIADFDA